METRQQRLIRQALERSRDTTGAGDDKTDGSHNGSGWRVPESTSLRGKSLRRAAPEYLPRTLTAHEWEDYYREHGVPPEHRRAVPSQGKSRTDSDELTGHRRSVD